ncbi:PREDICTED: location of vulva defective 1-like [Polistes dominula]|uniref:Location of vulva defective 1-like n=1 Tax=Polistes dominula TaxID=743375 RepID=A0ABM1J7W2_POLDO|nr:PREDICTED: location of vulva defective 1-like [Polistes dominula]
MGASLTTELGVLGKPEAGTPVNNEEKVDRITRDVQFLEQRPRLWSSFTNSWNIPDLSSIGDIFKDDDKEDDDDSDAEKIPDINERLGGLEESQKEMISLLKKLSNDISAMKDQMQEQEINKNQQSPYTYIIIIHEGTDVKVHNFTSSTFLTSPPIIETSTFQTTQQTQSQTTEQNESTTVNSNAEIEAVSIESISQESSTPNIISSTSFPSETEIPSTTLETRAETIEQNESTTANSNVETTQVSIDSNSQESSTPNIISSTSFSSETEIPSTTLETRAETIEQNESTTANSNAEIEAVSIESISQENSTPNIILSTSLPVVSETTE